ncbi:thioredoxin domain-containing protein 9-like protein [Camelus ferus]|nr:thioredoxin domain-containing protein 9-like protein [Camelus ferus]
MFSKVLENQLLQTTKLVEEHLDSEIQKLDQMDEDELERLKEKRLEALRKAQQQKQLTVMNTHSTGDGANNLNPSSKFSHFLTSSSQGDSGLTKPFTRSTVGTARFGLEGEESDFSETNPGNTDDFSTETLEWRLGCSDILNYSGSLMEPPFQSQKKFGTNFTKLEKKTIRGKKYDSDSDDD